jgi:hypothetical protein
MNSERGRGAPAGRPIALSMADCAVRTAALLAVKVPLPKPLEAAIELFRVRPGSRSNISLTDQSVNKKIDADEFWDRPLFQKHKTRTLKTPIDVAAASGRRRIERIAFTETLEERRAML